MSGDGCFCITCCITQHFPQYGNSSDHEVDEQLNLKQIRQEVADLCLTHGWQNQKTKLLLLQQHPVGVPVCGLIVRDTNDVFQMLGLFTNDPEAT